MRTPQGGRRTLDMRPSPGKPVNREETSYYFRGSMMPLLCLALHFGPEQRSVGLTVRPAHGYFDRRPTSHAKCGHLGARIKTAAMACAAPMLRAEKPRSLATRLRQSPRRESVRHHAPQRLLRAKGDRKLEICDFCPQQLSGGWHCSLSVCGGGNTPSRLSTPSRRRRATAATRVSSGWLRGTCRGNGGNGRPGPRKGR
jgi:hypothetical protein